MTGFREWATAVFGEDHGSRLADDYSTALGRAYSTALGRALDAEVFHGTAKLGHAPTTPIQENEMKPEQITEVSATVDAGLTQDDVDGMNEAERLALVVGAAYGKALAERDEARETTWEAVARLEELVAQFPDTSFAHANDALDRAKDFIQRIRTPEAVDSEGSPTRKD